MSKLITVLLLLPLFAAAQPFPFDEIQGWEKSGETLVFNRDNLYEHINGASEFYLSYGFQQLQVARWEKSGSELTIEIYDHGTPLNAYGIYSMERSENVDAKIIGTEGYYDGTILNFVAGKYYVKMNSYNVDNAGASLLEALALKLAPKLCNEAKYPDVVALFPDDKRVRNSIQYISSEFMGLGFLGAATRAKYLFPAGAETLFVLERSSAEEIDTILKKYFAFTEEQPGDLSRSEFVLNDPFNGKVLLRRNGNYLVGATPANDETAISQLLNQIVDTIKK